MTSLLRFLRSMAGPRLCTPCLCWVFILGFFWPGTFVLAQGNPDALRNRLNYIFQPLNKSQVPSGFLAEYGIRLVNPEAYTGTVSSDNRVDMTVWRMLYISLYSSRIYGTNPLPTITTINNSIKSYASSPISIPVLHLNYAGLRTDALTANLLRVQNDQLYDVAGRPSSPYVSKTAFAAAPIKAHADQGIVQFILRSALFYTNTGKTLSSTQINFSDGRGYVTVSWNTPLSVNYTSVGTKSLYIKLRYTDGTSAECRTDFLVRELISPAARYGGTANLVQTFNATANHSGGRAFVRYSVLNATRTTTNPRIIRPLIVAEPFDASSVAPSVQENISYFSFIDDINSEPDPYDFNTQLDDVGGYDLIYVDYNNGTDDIRRNAVLLQEIIVWVNGRKPTTGTQQQNVILGMIMGGLVARYPLANMEKQRRTSPTAQNDHQTRLLITYDSPHRGLMYRWVYNTLPEVSAGWL